MVACGTSTRSLAAMLHLITAQPEYSTGALAGHLGAAVAISADGSTIVAGAPHGALFAGAADVYSKPPDGWATSGTPGATLTNAAGAEGHQLGHAVAVNADGSTIVLGTRGMMVGGVGMVYPEAAYIYTRPASGWMTSTTPGTSLASLTGVAGDMFGLAVAINGTGNTSVVGAPDVAGTGAAYIFSGLSSNADLSNLVLSDGTMEPPFAAGTTDYTASVAYSVSSLTVTPTASDPAATITVNGTAVVSSGASADIPLQVGQNSISIVVTAQDGTTTRIYTIDVTLQCGWVAYLPLVER